MNISSHLKEFGLTGYEAKVYIALLGLKQAKVSDIARTSSVPRNKIYTAVEALHKKGFVEIIPEKVAKFRAVPFSEATQLFIREQENRLRSLGDRSGKISSFLSSFSIENKEEDNSGAFLIYKTKKMIYKKLREIAGGAESMLFLAVSSEELAHLLPLAKSTSKNASVSVLCNVSEESIDLANKWQSFSELRHYEKTLPEKIAISDDNEAFIFNTDSSVALYSKDMQFVAFMRRFANMIWDGSISMEERTAEIKTGVPREEIKIFRGVENIYEVGKNASTSAKKCIVRIATEETFRDIIKHGIILLEKELLSEGVRLRYIVPINKSNLLEVRNVLKFAEVRHTNSVPMQIKIVDDAYCSMRQWESIEKEPVNIVSTSPSFIGTMKQYFEKVWSESLPAEKRIARLTMRTRVSKEALKEVMNLRSILSEARMETDV